MMKKAPSLWRLGDLPGIWEVADMAPTMAEIDHKWVTARPLGYYSLSNRIKLSWLVFTGRADALIWPGGQ